MSREIIQAIADIYKRHDPEDADFYTLEWVQEKCSYFYKSPKELLAILQMSQDRGINTEGALWSKEDGLAAHREMKYSGPVDAYSYELMEKSGELARLEAACKAEEIARKLAIESLQC